MTTEKKEDNAKQLSLKVLEAYTRDVGRGIVRIDHVAMDAIGVITGDTIEIKGRRRTVGTCLSVYPADEGKGIMRADGLIRNNAGISIGDTVIIRKIKAVAAETVVVAKLEAIPPLDERYLADSLESVSVTIGDNVMVPYFGGRLTFKVIGVKPDADAVKIFKNTKFKIEEREKSEKEVRLEQIISKLDSKIGEQEKILAAMIDKDELDEPKMAEVFKSISKLNELKNYFAKQVK